MTDTTTHTTPSSTTPDLQLSRTFDAPRSLVFEAWAKEEHLTKWFGPRAYPVVSYNHDFRSGGAFEYVMRGPEGQDAPGGGTYLEVVENERIVSLSSITAGDEVIFEVRQTMTFADAEGGGTRFSLESFILINRDFPGAEGMEQGWQETLDRLGEFLDEPAS